MRNLINLVAPLFEAAPINPSELSNMKSTISSKIKDLPPDDATIKALREIEDLLRHVNAGGRMGMINGELQSINDQTVLEAQKQLARYLLSIEMTPAQREELFSLWRADKLVKRDVLLSHGKKQLSDIITNYSKNPGIREFVDDIMRHADLGQGKGEFGLSALSKSINKQSGKGDLDINGRAIEVKTTDGGAGRFTDQEVRPGPGFEQAARDLAAYVKPYISKVNKSGPNIDNFVHLYEVISTNPDMKKEAADLIKLIESCIALIFDGENVKPIIEAIKSGNINGTKQEYAKACFNYYMSKKKDEGVLYINLKSDPVTTVFFKDAAELTSVGLRLHAGTFYITSVADVRLPYPQMKIVDSSSPVSDADFDDDGNEINDIENEPVAAPKSIVGGHTTITPPGKRPASQGVGREERAKR